MTSALLHAVVSAPPSLSSDVPANAKDLAHHNKTGGGFSNPWPSWTELSTLAIAREIFRFFSDEWGTPDTRSPNIPLHKPVFLPSRKTPQLRTTWLGHASYYIEFPSGLRILTDPVFTERCSPTSYLGPKRYTPAPCQVVDIATIDAVMISHSHYDHLSYPTILDLKKHHPNAHFFVPLGLKAWFAKCGITKCTELDWWQSVNVDFSPTADSSPTVSAPTASSPSPAEEAPTTISATFQCLPAQHTSARSSSDKAQTLWASWSLLSGDTKVWFAGDTGYRAVPRLPKDEDDWGPGHDYPCCPAFKDIGAYAGPFDLGLIPIGAYRPRYIMSPMHVNPFDSVEIFVQSRCKRALAMHWGTWLLTGEDVDEPPRLLAEAVRRKGLGEDVFVACGIGESREFAKE